MSPKVTHRQRYGCTTNWRPAAVYVSRTARLNESLDQIQETKVRAVILSFGDGYEDSAEHELAPENALELYHVLKAALVALDLNVDEEPLADWEKELLAGADASSDE